MAVGRTETMHELITTMEELFSDTILGSDINLIKHLFYFLKINDIEFMFTYEEHDLHAVIIDIHEDTVECYVDGIEPGPMKARIHFEVINKLYSFEVAIVVIEHEHVTFRIPNELQSVQFRKNKRVNCDDLFMNFIILFRSIYGGERQLGSTSFTEGRFHHLIQEVRKDSPSLEVINKIMMEYVFNVSRDYELKFFSGENTDYIRDYLQKTGKSILIQDCNEMDSYIGEMDEDNITNFRGLYLEIMERDPLEAVDFLEDLQRNERRNFLISYIIVPIYIYEDVRGYLKIFTTAMDKYHISMYQADYLHSMSEILSYAFTKVTIRQQKYDMLNVTTKIVDISMTGLLFEIEDRKLFNYLTVHNIIKMMIPIGLKKITIIGKIVRFIDKKDTFLMAVNYFSSSPDDMVILENYIYEKSTRLLFE